MTADVLTDYILCIITLLIGAIFFHYKKSWFWIGTFVLISLSAFFAAKYHEAAEGGEWMWHVSMVCIGVASMSMILAVSENNNVLVVGSVIKLYIYLRHLMTREDKTTFTPAIINTFIALMTVLFVTWGQSPTLSAGVAALAMGNIYQYFIQDNTTFHLIQIITMMMIGFGAFQLK
jgi:hypothetical protein